MGRFVVVGVLMEVVLLGVVEVLLGVAEVLLLVVEGSWLLLLLLLLLLF